MAGKFAICKLDPSEPIPLWATAPPFFSITRTSDELSVVSAHVPDNISCEKDWIIFKVAGPLAFNLTGILASIAQPLAEVKVSIFAISTFDTDYILIKESSQEISIRALREAGFEVII